jgi:hypothetical protein
MTAPPNTAARIVAGGTNPKKRNSTAGNTLPQLGHLTLVSKSCKAGATTSAATLLFAQARSAGKCAPHFGHVSSFIRET